MPALDLVDRLDLGERVRKSNRCTRIVPPFLLAASAGVAVSTLAGQQPVRVSSDVVCAECVITIDTVVTLGGLDGEGVEAIHLSSTVAIDARERILVANIMEPRIYVFDMAGRFLRTVGGPGEGPGEYGWISHVNAGQRYIHVFEYDGRTLLDHDFAFVRRDRFPGQVRQSFVMDTEVVAFSSWIPSPDAAGHTLHLLAPSGEMKSHGDSRHRVPDLFGGVVTGGGTSLWTIEWESTTVTQWDLLPEPTVARIWRRAVDEWDRHDRGPNGLAVPRPVNTGAMLDERGLWIVRIGPDPALGERPSEQNRPKADPVQYMGDSWVELLDPNTGETLARYFDKGFLFGFAAGSRYLVGYHETEAGVPYIHLLEPRLSRGGAGPGQR